MLIDKILRNPNTKRSKRFFGYERISEILLEIEGEQLRVLKRGQRLDMGDMFFKKKDFI
jgi:hypothetical protein